MPFLPNHSLSHLSHFLLFQTAYLTPKDAGRKSRRERDWAVSEETAEANTGTDRGICGVLPVLLPACLAVFRWPRRGHTAPMLLEGAGRKTGERWAVSRDATLQKPPNAGQGHLHPGACAPDPRGIFILLRHRTFTQQRHKAPTAFDSQND